MNHEEINVADLDPNLSPEDTLALLVGDRAERLQSKAEVTAVTARHMKMANAQVLDNKLPPDDKLHEYWTVVHTGAGSDGDALISLLYTGVYFEDAEGNFFKRNIGSGLCWVHGSMFDGHFLDKNVQHAVDVGVIELHPPGTTPNPRTFSKEFREAWGSGALMLCKDSRTLKYIAGILGDRSSYTEALLKKAAQLAIEGK